MLRFTGSEINSQIDKVVDTILRALELRGVDISEDEGGNDAEMYYREGLLESGRLNYDDGGAANYERAVKYLRGAHK